MILRTKIKQVSLAALLVGPMLGLLAWQLENRRTADQASVVAAYAHQAGYLVMEIAEVLDAVAHFKGESGEITVEDVRHADFEEQLGGYQLPDLSAYHIELVPLLTAEMLATVPAIYVPAESSDWQQTEESCGSIRLLFVDPKSGFVGCQFTDGLWGLFELKELLDRLESGSGEFVPFRDGPVLKFTTALQSP